MSQTVKGAMTNLRHKWDATWQIIEQAVARGKARKHPSPLPHFAAEEPLLAPRAGIAADRGCPARIRSPTTVPSFSPPRPAPSRSPGLTHSIPTAFPLVGRVSRPADGDPHLSPPIALAIQRAASQKRRDSKQGQQARTGTAMPFASNSTKLESRAQNCCSDITVLLR